MAENDKLTASDLKSILVKRFGADKMLYSVRTVARLRNDLGWTYTTAKYCQAIRDGNKAKRLDWCNKRMEEKEAFDDVIFTDESIVQLECYRQKYFQKKPPRKLKYKHKHPPKVHLWGRITKQGATQLVNFDWIMNANRYCDILKASIVPFINKSYPECHRL